jgi:L-amino acid N-acyltransferase YncA
MPCKPRFRPTGAPLGRKTASKLKRSILQVRQLNNLDLDEVNRLQNCLESTKSSFRVPPVTREQTKQWYEGITSERHRHCLACFSGDKLRGYLQFRALLLPFPCLKLEEVIVDANEESYRTAAALVEALRSFRERYRYRMISAFVPQTSAQIAGAFEGQGFRKTGSLKNYYFIDGFYVDAIFREYP